MEVVENKLNGQDSIPALNGGFITIKRKDKTLHIASVPSFNFYGKNWQASKMENSETFIDENKNKYTIDIISANDGVEWELKILEIKENIDKNELIENLNLIYEMVDY